LKDTFFTFLIPQRDLSRVLTEKSFYNMNNIPF